MWTRVDEGLEKECFRCVQCQLANMTWVAGSELMKKPKPPPLPINKTAPPEDD